VVRRSNLFRKLTVNLWHGKVINLHHIELSEKRGIHLADQLDEVIALHRHESGLEICPDMLSIRSEGQSIQVEPCSFIVEPFVTMGDSQIHPDPNIIRLDL
jgi:hypothetical protein